MLTLNEARTLYGLPQIPEKQSRQVWSAEDRKKRLEDFRMEVRRLARSAGLEVEVKDGPRQNQINVVFRDAGGRFGVFLDHRAIFDAPLDYSVGIVKRNLSRKDRGQW